MLEWLETLEWSRVLPEIVGKGLGVFFGIAVSWYVLFRKRLQALGRFKAGDSDDVLFQAHYLWPDGESGNFILLFRNIAPTMTINDLYDNDAARQLVVELAGETSLQAPVLPTSGRMGFEILNGAFGHIAGHLATTAFERQIWLFTMTCEDRQVVRRKCVRCFLVRPQDLARFEDWQWCRTHVLCEQPWHWYRIVALHQIALNWRKEQQEAKVREASSDTRAPLVDEHVEHRRIRSLSAGIHPNEIPTGTGVTVPWDQHERELLKIADLN